MKKVYISIIIVQAVLVIMFLVYALVMREQAIKDHEKAIHAEVAQKIAEKNEILAQQAQAAAVEQLRLCTERRSKP